jgi:hypothetical protein
LMQLKAIYQKQHKAKLLNCTNFMLEVQKVTDINPHSSLHTKMQVRVLCTKINRNLT